jgi:predicted MFS family arabinose efflux permease
MMQVLLRARLSVSVLFLVHGLVFATWVSRIPAVQSRLGLRPSELGLALLGVAAGSIVSMPLAGIIMARRGTAVVAAASSLAFCVALGFPALARNAVELGIALGLLGMAAGSMDVSMNAQGVAVEERYGRSLMSSFHALFSIGGMAGAAIGGAVASAGVDPSLHLATAGAACLILVAAAIPNLIPHDRHAFDGGRGTLRIGARPAALAAVAFCFFLAEGAIADWSGLYLRKETRAGAGTAALGYAVFSAAMALGRLSGDWLIDRFGRFTLMRAGSGVAALGLSAALALGTVPAALVGFGLTGAGCSIIVPMVFAAAGRIRDLPAGAALTMVTAAGYFGLFAGPPSIGFLADATGLRAALVLVVVLLFSGALFARSAG